MLEFTPLGLYVIQSFFFAQNLPPLPPLFFNFHYLVAQPLRNIYLVSTAIFPSSILYISVISFMYGETGSEKGISFLGCLERTRKTTPAMRWARGRCHNVLLTSWGSYRSKVSLALLTADKGLAKRSVFTHNSCVRSTEYWFYLSTIKRKEKPQIRQKLY